MTFEEALIGAQDDHLHPTVRSKYVELIIGNYMIFKWKLYMLYVNYTALVLYVDVGDNRAILDNLSFSFVSYVCICRAHINIAINCMHT